MLISDRKKFIFIHIGKNAGTSVSRALLPFATNKLFWYGHKALPFAKNEFVWYAHHGWQWIKANLFNRRRFGSHVRASHIIDVIGREKFDSYFSFAFVRNPWDRQVSYYKYMTREPPFVDRKTINRIKSFGSFDNYVKWRCTRRRVRLQKDWVYSKDGELLVDFVGRYENLKEDFDKICSRIGVSASLPRANVSNTKPYREFYTEETRELVREAFKPDIETFGYEF